MISIIITAGGIGKRMGSDLPKQFITLEEKPILLHTIECFYRTFPEAEILVTLPLEWRDYWIDQVNKLNCKIPHRVISGGIERYDSIKNALEEATGDFIFIHDGVRPFVSSSTLLNCLEKVRDKGIAVPYLPIKESLRNIANSQNVAVLRNDYVLVQTPQCFSSQIITAAYNQPYHQGITDDASLVEQLGHSIELVLGNEENIKITTPFDLLVAKAIVELRDLK